ncbi:hypothetical protein GGI59_004685 [Rhizobium lentis]|uniref:Uncharacterized protein n=1 Tax=Rhizobium lentis TaxID=1138194 RepID=A0A7W9CX10_9HYPH|nr:hypothetical protein [Rhizobium lentis]
MQVEQLKRLRHCFDHRFGYQVGIVIADFEQTKAELITPAWPATCEGQSVEQWPDRCFHRRPPRDIPPPGVKVGADFYLICIGCLDDANCRKCLQAIRAAECFGRRVVDYAIAGRAPPKRSRLSVTDLHEPCFAPGADVIC